MTMRLQPLIYSIKTHEKIRGFFRHHALDNAATHCTPPSKHLSNRITEVEEVLSLEGRTACEDGIIAVDG